MKVCVLGLGQMGSAIAERLITGGHQVTVWNRSPGKADDLLAMGAREVSRADAWAECDVAVTMLADSSALTQIALGKDGLAVSGEAGGKLLIDMSTVSADASREVARSAEAVGLRYLRAPVSGNPGVVRAGKLTIVASGPRDVFDEALELLSDIGARVLYAGDGESARIIKLALNLMIAGTAELLAECIALAEGHGIDRATLLEVVGASAVGSPFVAYKSAPLIADDYRSTFTTRLMRKDVDLALEAAAQAGVPLPVTAQVQQLLQAAISSGYADLDFMALLLKLQRDAGQRS